MAKGGQPTLRDPSITTQAGINPKTGRPIKEGDVGKLKKDIRMQLRVLDEQDAVNRYKWAGDLPNISSIELERLLYFNPQIIYWYFEELDEYVFTKYTLVSDVQIPLDFLGRPRFAKPIPIREGISDEEKITFSRMRTIMSQKKLKVLYSIPDDISSIKKGDVCVMLNDYTPQMEYMTSISRSAMQESLLSLEAVCFPYMRTALKNGVGIEGLRVNGQNEADSVYAFNKTFDVAAEEGDAKIPIYGAVDLQEITNGNVSTASEFLMAYQGLENFRRGLYGVSTSGVMQKKEHTLQSEQEANGGSTSSPLQDGLEWRTRFCDIAKAVYQKNITCTIGESMKEQEVTSMDYEEPSKEDNSNDE